MIGSTATGNKHQIQSAFGVVVMIVAMPTLVSCGGQTARSSDATQAVSSGGYRVALQRWQKDAYRNSAGLTPGWPRHTTLAVSIIDPSGSSTLACEADNHGSSLASGLVQQSGSAQLCPSVFASLEEAQSFAATICNCVCDNMGSGATAFLNDNAAADLAGVKKFLTTADHSPLNQALNCNAGAGADPTQRIADDVLATPPRYSDALQLLASDCSPDWDRAFNVLLGGVWGAYHVCNNDAALEERACSSGACPAWGTDSDVIRNACDGPRIMHP
jgi:hypothetical protein